MFLKKRIQVFFLSLKWTRFLSTKLKRGLVKFPMLWRSCRFTSMKTESQRKTQQTTDHYPANTTDERRTRLTKLPATTKPSPLSFALYTVCRIRNSNFMCNNKSPATFFRGLRKFIICNEVEVCTGTLLGSGNLIVDFGDLAVGFKLTSNKR